MQDIATVPLVLMTADEARQCVNRIKGLVGDIRKELLDLHEREGWRALGYASWRECGEAEFPYKQAMLYKLLDAARVDRELYTIVEKPLPETHARELAPILHDAPEQVAEVYAEAQERFGDDMTAADIRTVVQEHIAPKPEPRLTAFEALTGHRFDEEGYERGPAVRQPMAVHYSSETPEWYTPKPIIERVQRCLGQIDVDPCSNTGTPNVPALLHYTAQEDGLAHEWRGKVYMNPPYGRAIAPWVEKFRQEYTDGNMIEGIALVPARTDTDWFRLLRDCAVCFIDGRLHFNDSDAGAPFPSCAVYAGPNVKRFAEVFGAIGDVWTRWSG